jgi:hypothetical protein
MYPAKVIELWSGASPEATECNRQDATSLGAVRAGVQAGTATVGALQWALQHDATCNTQHLRHRAVLGAACQPPVFQPCEGQDQAAVREDDRLAGAPSSGQSLIVPLRFQLSPIRLQ